MMLELSTEPTIVSVVSSLCAAVLAKVELRRMCTTPCPTVAQSMAQGKAQRDEMLDDIRVVKRLVVALAAESGIPVKELKGELQDLVGL